MINTQQDVMDGIQHYYPNGLTQFDVSKPTPTNYSEYLGWTQEPTPLTELELTEGAAATRLLRDNPVAETTKLSIMRKLQALGKWATFKQMLTSLPDEAQDAWELAQVIRSDDPMFLEYATTIQETLDLTEIQFKDLLQP